MEKSDSVRLQQYLIGGLSLLLVVILIIAAAVEMKKTRTYKADPVIDSTSEQCINCHEKKGIAANQITAWKESEHGIQGIGCKECHKAKKGEFDAFLCPESSILVARHPTPKDCKECHKQQVEEFAESKHAHQFWLLANADRATFENPITTKHGCVQCHQIGNIWPDGSVGECDACHAKHSYSLAVARQPETCGECHIGPDH
ncbi:cytochrome C, partial [Candidatus Pacearchaeota archaeon]|nr:cytochrome C [Candidatus Pacearchaeota archaeon]